MKRSLMGESRIDEYTLLLLHGNDYADGSIYNREILNGGAGLSDYGKFGRCLDFDGKGYKLRTPIAPFNFGSGDFTFDFWIKLKSSASNKVLINTGTPNTWKHGYQITLDDTGKEGIVFVYAPTPSVIRIPVSYSELKSGFNHVAFAKSNSMAYAFFNGNKTDQIDVTSIPDSIEPYLSIGSHRNGESGMDCYIDEFRISNIARWTSNFTPPIKPY